MDDQPIRRDVAAYLSGDDLAEVFAAKLGRWRETGRPAILIALDLDEPFADVYPEAELLATFPAATIVRPEGCDDAGGDTLLVYVVHEEGETAFAVPWPGRPGAARPIPDRTRGRPAPA